MERTVTENIDEDGNLVDRFIEVKDEAKGYSATCETVSSEELVRRQKCPPPA